MVLQKKLIKRGFCVASSGMTASKWQPLPRADVYAPERFCSSARFVTWLNEQSKLAYAFHQTLDNYEPTPLVNLAALATSLDVASIKIKDEGQRFGLKSFKALGSSYAVHKLDLTSKGGTVTSMTDGNHGRGLAWIAKEMNLPCVIFVPANVSGPRIQAIEDLGATVIKIEGNYDEAIERVKSEAEKNNWTLIADSSWPGYISVCADIVAGYCTIFSEIQDYEPTHVFVCGGVGGFAAAGAHYVFQQRFLRNNPAFPKLICVEPHRADCLYLSAEQDTIVTTDEDCDSIMQGLNCGTPSLVSWELLHDAVDFFVRVGDNHAIDAVRTLYEHSPSVVAGESGGAGLAGLLSLTSEQKTALQIDASSRILLVNTEADTDPELFQDIIHYRI